MMQSSSRLFKILRWLLLVLLLALAIGAIYQAAAAARDRRTVKPLGKLVEVDGRAMHLYCQGNGSPTVIVEAGMGASGVEWVQVQDALAPTTQTCIYDRLGAGWSDRAPEPQSSVQVADTLHDLLAAANVPAPYVLVGHSLGGVHARAFANRYPAEMSGLVLVDSSHELQRARFPEWALEEDAAFLSQMQLCRVLAPVGLVRLLGFADDIVAEFEVDDTLKSQFIVPFNRTETCAMKVDELLAYEASATVNQPPPSLSDLPLVVLTRGIREAEEIPAEEYGDNFTRADVEALDTLWDELQSELAALSTNSTATIAEESGHMIHFDQPELIIDAVRMILGESTP